MPFQRTFSVLYVSGIPAQPAAIAYTARPGDTMSGIAARYGENLATLEFTNHSAFPDPNLIRPGQILTVNPGLGAVRSVPVAARVTASTAVSVSAQQGIAAMDARGLFGGNLMSLGQYLVAHGYTRAAAAGIAACVAGESSGDPEAVGDGGGGLIGWTPLPEGFITGDQIRDLQFQMPQVLAYNLRQNPGAIPAFNAIGNPVAAADFYSQNFERPAVADSDVVASAAEAVFTGLGG
jgi:LysM repeat protein